MQFLHSPLTWAFFLVLAPVLIHLINMLRHRRVKWAAMDFLLQSYKKHRKWVWLKQFLLLLLRMLAVAAAVAMLAQLITSDQWSALFGRQTTHHYVLLDDSYSMGERTGSASAYERGLDAVAQIVTRASEQETPQRITLLRFSQASLAAAPPEAANSDGKNAAGERPAQAPAAETDEKTAEGQVRTSQSADLVVARADAELPARFAELRRTLAVSELAAEPEAALQVVVQMLGDAPGDRHVVHLVSDFRSRSWQNPTAQRELFEAIEAKGGEIHLVRCVRQQQANLGVVEIAPSDETRAAGVPLPVNVKVKNFGTEPVRKVAAKIRSIFYEIDENAARGKPSAGITEDLSALLFEEIGPGETVTRQTQVVFPRPGEHVVEVVLPDDPLPVDNRRQCVVHTPAGEPVLLVDGHATGRNAYFLTSVFTPGQRTNTGIRPVTKTEAYLRDVTPAELLNYSAIYLLDVRPLDKRAVENLEAYVKGGGGLAIFAGASADIPFYNATLYAGGKGLFPAPLVDPQEKPAAAVAPEPSSLEIANHPLLAVFLGERNSLLRRVEFTRWHETTPGWQPPVESSVRIVARLRNGRPLLLEQAFGEGRVLAVLSSLAPEWNNWTLDPSFIVLGLRLQSYLAAGARVAPDFRVGQPLQVAFETEQYRGEVAFLAPGESPEEPVLIERQAARPAADSPLLSTLIGQSADEARRTGETDRSGVYEAFLLKNTGLSEVRRFALNVDPAEGDLHLSSPSSLVEKLAPAKVQVHEVTDLAVAAQRQAGFRWSEALLWLLVIVLLGEQLLAYAASYHPLTRGAK